MTRQEYLDRLSKYLKRLPKEDYDAAMEYFNEYFDEAGAVHEAETIEALGTPKEAAEQVIMDAAVHQSEHMKSGLRGKFSALWIIILAICAAPIGVPLAAAAVITLIAVAVSVLICILCVVLLGICAVFVGVVSISASIIGFAAAPASAAATIGVSLIIAGIGIITAWVFVYLCIWLMRLIVQKTGRFIKGRRKQDEKEGI